MHTCRLAMEGDDSERMALALRVFMDHHVGRRAIELRRENEALRAELDDVKNELFHEEYVALASRKGRRIVTAVERFWAAGGRQGLAAAAARHGIVVAFVEPNDLLPAWLGCRRFFACASDVTICAILGPHRVDGESVHVGPMLWPTAGWNAHKQGLKFFIAEAMAKAAPAGPVMFV